jgi:hypothetical protein
MSEEPKSIWKKSWNGWRGLLLGWALLSGGLIAILLIWLLAEHVSLTRAGDELKLFGFFGGVVTLVFLFIPFVRWLCCWRNVKRTLFGIACFATLLAVFYAEENWRGKHDWEKFQREWVAKGEKFDWQSVVPPPVPDDQNFAFSPVWIAEERFHFKNDPKRAEAWYGNRIYNAEVSKIFLLFPMTLSAVVGTNWAYPNTPEISGKWGIVRMTDLKPWQSFYRDLENTNPAVEISITPQPQSPAQDVLLALSKFDPVIEQLRQDSARPYSRFPISYNTQPPAAILLPHLAAEKRFADVLQLRALAELQNEQSEKALDDVNLMLRLTDASRTEAFLISHLVRIVILNLTLQPIYEGLAEHKWSDAQLAGLDSQLAKLDFLADYKAAVRGERGLEIANIELFKHPRDLNIELKRPRFFPLAPLFPLFRLISYLSGPGDDSHINNFSMLALNVGPSGWLSQNQLRLARFDTKWYLPIVDEEIKTISPAKARVAGAALTREVRHRTSENVLETLMIPVLDSGAVKFAHAQAGADLARVAIALERYRLAHGEYPESLDALAPQIINAVPHDVIGGGPLHYRRTADGQFVLYSIGWNEQDDGGVVVFKKGSSPDVDLDKGDWVWCYPVK